MMQSNNKITIIGGTSWNTIIHLGSPLNASQQTLFARSYYEHLGGTGAGKALNLSALGFEAILHTVLGQDREAKLIQQACQKERLNLLIESSDALTEKHTNLMQPNGDRISIYTQFPPTPSRIDWQNIETVIKSSALVIVNILDYTRPALSIAQHYKKPLWIDIHDYDGCNPYHEDFIEASHVLFLSSCQLPHYRDFMREQINLGKSLVVCTHGKDGASALDAEGRWYEQSIVSDFTPYDSNGAGDAFFSGFVYSHLIKHSIAKNLKYASIVAGTAISSEQLYHHKLTSKYLEQLFETFFTKDNSQ